VSEKAISNLLHLFLKVLKDFALRQKLKVIHC